MIERYVFVRLKPEHATEHSRAEVRARSATLANVPGVTAVAVGTPADAGARSAWDLSLCVRFTALADVERYLEHPLHAQYRSFLEPRVQVIKAWNFEL